ncbi:solute carrier family 25 protein [archaeon]|nr:MAG: solute carrier family 25 protein [archaeon]
MEEQDVLPPKPQTHYNNVRFSLFAGAVAGIAAKTCIAPAERIKMSFQVSSEKFSWRKALERGHLMVVHEGPLSLWKGHSTTILRVAPYAGISYMAHDVAENFFKQLQGSNSVPPLYKFLAGSFGGVCGTIMVGACMQCSERYVHRPCSACHNV